MMRGIIAHRVAIVDSFLLAVGSVDLLQNFSLVDVVVLDGRNLDDIGDKHVNGGLTRDVNEIAD